jgi:NAD(P)-dependent dehydrogenase (short-subunit alcohol dehydrogenase family)
MPLVAAYTASKYAIEGFSESLAYELAMFGVRVKIVEPGSRHRPVSPPIPADVVMI